MGYDTGTIEPVDDEGRENWARFISDLMQSPPIPPPFRMELTAHGGTLQATANNKTAMRRLLLQALIHLEEIDL